MSRVRLGSARKQKHKKVLKDARGYVGANSRHYRLALQSTLRAGAYATRDRKTRKRNFRSLWITRINAASRAQGLSYSVLMNGLKKAGININRKMLSELAINDMAAFTQLADQARNALGK